MEDERPKFFTLDEGTEDFYNFPDNWDEDEKEEPAVEVDVDLKKAVLVDSSAFHRKILKDHLLDAGFKIAGSVGGAVDACPILTESKVRFAAVDIDQTDGGGAKALQIIAARVPQTVFIMTSSRLTAEQTAQGGLGGHYFLSKPFQREKVNEVFKKAYEAELAKKKSTAGPQPAR